MKKNATLLRSSFLPLTKEKKKPEITDNTKQSYTKVKWYSFCTPVCLHRFIPDNNSVFLCFSAVFSVNVMAPTTSETLHIFAVFFQLSFSFHSIFAQKLSVSFIIAGILLFFICFDTYTKIYIRLYIERIGSNRFKYSYCNISITISFFKFISVFFQLQFLFFKFISKTMIFNVHLDDQFYFNRWFFLSR